jgi:hypothetical protein
VRPAARVRHELARRPWLSWTLVVALATTTFVATRAHGERVERARLEWGRSRAVLVAAAPVAPGDELAALVEVRELPAAMLPPSALAELPAGSVARQRVDPGEVVTGADVGIGSGLRALVPDGWLGVAVVEAVPSGVAVGDRVVVASAGVEVTTDAVVVGTGLDVVHLAVPRDLAATVAAASVSPDGVSLLLVP